MNKRIIVFKDTKSKRNGFKTLHIVREPFAYRGDGKYVISKKQCVILKEQDIEFNIKRYI